LVSSAAAQELEVIELVWTQPVQADVPIMGFKVHYGPEFEAYIEVIELYMPEFHPGDYTYDDGINPPVTVSGYYRAEVEVLVSDLPLWFAVSAYNATQESHNSRTKCFGSFDVCGLAPEPPVLVRLENECERTDLNMDGAVGMDDFSILSDHWNWRQGMECIPTKQGPGR
jgi:hypothetical protein